jgi:hypothetical protein
MGALAVLAWAQAAHISPWQELQRGMDWLVAEMQRQAVDQSMDAVDWADQKREWLRGLPSTVMIAALLQSWVALTVMLRLNPRRIRERLVLPVTFHRLWRNPEVLVWPTLAAGFGALLLGGPASVFCLNWLKVFLALYGLQGLAVLACVLDVWKIRGLARVVVFFFVVSLMLPLILAVGFFDLWFDFRAKLGQS